MASYKTKKPTGLKVTRAKKVLTVEWKKGDSGTYWKQQRATQLTSSYKEPVYVKKVVGYKTKKGKKTPIWKWEISKWERKPQKGKQNTIDISANATSSKLEISTSKFYPNTDTYLDKVQFWIRGCLKDFDQNNTHYVTSWSDWVSVEYKIDNPHDPTISQQLTSNENECTFKWAKNSKDTDSSKSWFTDFEWQTLLVPNCNTNNGNNISWDGVSRATGSKTQQTVKETVVFNGYYSYTRWYRVRARGPKGTSSWVYARHVYAMPPVPTGIKATATGLSGGQGYQIDVRWTANASYAHPIDKTVLAYSVDVPQTVTRSNKTINGVIWSHTALATPQISQGTEISVTADTNGEDGTRFNLVPKTEEDKCVIVSVTTHHDKKDGPGAPVYVSNAFGKLTAPVITEVGTPDPTTRKMTVRATNGSAVNNIFIAIWCRTLKHPSSPKCIGVIEKGTTSTIVTLPVIDEDDNYSIGAQTFLADYSPVGKDLLTCDYFTYSISNKLMQSDIVWDSRAIPKPPEDITLSMPAGKVGTIRVSWDWSWADATGAELSWSQDPDAWESTEAPNTYIVESTRASGWNITGLDVGTWYVRVRLLREEGDIKRYGTYSAQKEITISVSPATPSLVANPATITEEEETTCTWVYTTSDGTEQAHAVINEMIPGYSEVASPTGSPVDKSYFEKGRLISGDITYAYVLSSDTSVTPEKIYYSRSGSGTSGDPYVYTPIDEPTGNPSTSGYYEQTITSIANPVYIYVPSKDQELVSGKTYYLPTGEYSEGKELERSTTAQYMTISAEKSDWQSGEIHYIAIKVTSASNQDSENWSVPVPITIADRPSVEITSTSLVSKTIEVEPEEQITTTYNALTTMPLSVTAIGAGSTGETRVTITRAEPYHVSRPDEKEIDGFEGETIALVSQQGEGLITINQDDLVGYLDDGALYELTVTVIDSYGQSEDSDPIEFKVEWDHQAIIPTAEVQAFEDGVYTTIKPLAPVGEYELSMDIEVDPEKTYYTRSGSGTEEDPYVFDPVISPEGNPHENLYYEEYDYSTDTCDIYRLSVDPPSLIYSDAEIGTKYVDPYPTLGQFGGYRIVYKTSNGDYITKDNLLAWSDYTDRNQHQINLFATIIDFEQDRVILPYNLSLSNQWKKDFTETKYLGGSVQGDWNPGISRTSSVNTTTVVEEDPDTIVAMRRLAIFPGVCHIRTPEGSSFSANVEVSEDREEKWVNRLAKFSLSITRVDSQNDEAIEYDKWITE